MNIAGIFACQIRRYSADAEVSRKGSASRKKMAVVLFRFNDVFQGLNYGNQRIKNGAPTRYD